MPLSIFWWCEYFLVSDNNFDFTIHRFLNMILDSIFLLMTSGVKDTWWYRSLFKQDGRWFGVIDWCTWNCSLPNLVLHAFCANPDFAARKRSKIESCLHTWIDTALCARFNKLTSGVNSSVLLLIMISTEHCQSSWGSPRVCANYFDSNVMTKFIFSSRTGAWKTVNYLMFAIINY